MMRPARQKRGKKKRKQRNKQNNNVSETPVVDMMGSTFIDRVMTSMETYPPHDVLGITKDLRERHSEYKSIHISEFNQHVQKVVNKLTGGKEEPQSESIEFSQTSGSAAVTPEKAAAKPVLLSNSANTNKPVPKNNMNSRITSRYKKSNPDNSESGNRDGMIEINANVHTVSESGKVSFMPKRAKDRLRALEAARARKRVGNETAESGGGAAGVAKAHGMANFDEMQMQSHEFSSLKRKRHNWENSNLSNGTNSNQSTNTGEKPNNNNNNNNNNEDPEEPEMKELQLRKRRRKAQVEYVTGRGYADLGGIEHILSDIRELIEWPLQHPEIYAELGVEPPRGILLHGPPGCGKTLLATSVAGELGIPFLKISAPEIVSGMSGESESKLRGLFKDAMSAAPALVFIDEIDAITPKRETAMREMERRIVAQLLTCMDDLTLDKMDGNAVIVIGATNRPDALDPALRRAGRFDREISMGIPDEDARSNILKVITSKMKLEGEFDYGLIARKTPGFVGADLNALAKEAAVLAVNRIFSNIINNQHKGTEEGIKNEADNNNGINNNEENAVKAMDTEESNEAENVTLKHIENDENDNNNNNYNENNNNNNENNENSNNNENNEELSQNQNNTATSVSDHIKTMKASSGTLSKEQLGTLSITMHDFLSAVKKVQPSSLREGFTTIPDVSWADVGAMSHIREELDIAVVEAVKHPEKYEQLGLTGSAGVLLYGPPGCGKTLVAKAIAKESGANFISIKGPELLNKYVGESERAVRQVFERGQTSSPCVVFFDELDALCPRRSDSNNQSTERVVNQLLTCMDGLEPRRQVFVVAATNRPDIIDPAMLRPGRLDKMLYVPLPSPDGRTEILQALTRKVPLDVDVDLSRVAHDPRCEGFSGADLAALVREASLCALRESLRSKDDDVNNLIVKKPFFEEALFKVSPSVTEKDRKLYDRMQYKLRQVRAELKNKKREETPKKNSKNINSNNKNENDDEPAMQTN